MENSTATSSDTLHKIGVTRTNTESSILAHIETSGRSKKGKRFRSINVARCKRILLAFLSRCLFTVHSLLLLGILVNVKDNPQYWALLIGVLGLYLEMFVTLAVTKKGEWKWFSPTVFIYLCVAIPCIFLLELHLREDRVIALNVTLASSHHLSKVPDFLLEPLEQIMVLVLVIGRWLMPKGEMTRDQLAELLRIYIGLGADILDLLRLVKEPTVGKDRNVAVVGLCLFGWALMQFTLVLTQTQSSQHKEMSGHPEEDPKAAVTEDGCWSWCSIEVWPLVIAVVMQDGPFLAFRLYLIIIHKMNTNSMIFFICKNILTLIIEIYNIIVVLRAHKQKDKK